MRNGGDEHQSQGVVVWAAAGLKELYTDCVKQSSGVVIEGRVRSGEYTTGQ